jgi:hypothetical protein
LAYVYYEDYVEELKESNNSWGVIGSLVRDMRERTIERLGHVEEFCKASAAVVISEPFNVSILRAAQGDKSSEIR